MYWQRNLLLLKTVSENGVANVVELRGDALEQLQKSIDRVVHEGAAHVTVVVTYAGGHQIVLNPTSAPDHLKAVGFR